MKKFIIGIVSLIIVGSIGYGAWFYWQHLRGIGPAVNAPRGDISTTLTPTGASQVLKVPSDFQISIWAKDLGSPRALARGESDELLVSIPKAGTIVALKDTNADGSADQRTIIASGLNQPHGLATMCSGEGPCELYVAEADKISRFTYTQLQTSDKKVLLTLPDGGRHPLKNLQIIDTDSGRQMLVTVASACDACIEPEQTRGTVMIANIDGSDLKIFASGLRNAAFMAINPVTGDVWATEMGRDFLGDTLPPDEINILTEDQHYGWPFCYGNNQTDTTFSTTADKLPCTTPPMIPSHIDIPAHSAPLGLAFIGEEGWPEPYWYNLLVAFHGSWNSTEPTGYKIIKYKLSATGAYLGEEDFITGWLDDNQAWGRPVDILVQPGGTIYITDDKAGVIYHVVHKP